MRNKIFAGLFLLLSSFAQAQSVHIAGHWLLTRAEANGNAQEPYIFVDFTSDGKMQIMGKTMGSWNWYPQKHLLQIKSRQNGHLNGAGQVVKLTLNELVIEKDDIRFYYRKIYPDKIQKANREAQLTGLWKITRGASDAGLLRLRLPDIFEFVESANGVTDTTTGTWMYHPAPPEESIALVSFSPLRGKIVIKDKTAKRFSFVSKGSLYTAVRINK